MYTRSSQYQETDRRNLCNITDKNLGVKEYARKQTCKLERNKNSKD
jgi:hypothetical protein